MPDRPEAALRRVARRIAAIREARGITQDEMAEKLRCATRNYQRIEYGQNVTIKMLVRIANLLGVTVTELVPPPPQRGGYSRKRNVVDTAIRSPQPLRSRRV